MYLHGFTDPHIYEYDTLTSQDRWNEYADVILANPPFMSPKGGIKPHNRFSVQSQAQRSAVRGLHGRAPDAQRPRRHHRARRHHLPEPDRLHAAAQDAGRGVPRRGRLAASGRLQSVLRRQDFDPASSTRHLRSRQTRSPSSRSRTTASASAPSVARSTRTTCHRRECRDRRIPAPPAGAGIGGGLRADARASRAEGEDCRERRLQPEWGAVPGEWAARRSIPSRKACSGSGNRSRQPGPAGERVLRPR